MMRQSYLCAMFIFTLLSLSLCPSYSTADEGVNTHAIELPPGFEGGWKVITRDSDDIVGSYDSPHGELNIRGTDRRFYGRQPIYLSSYQAIRLMLTCDDLARLKDLPLDAIEQLVIVVRDSAVAPTDWMMSSFDIGNLKNLRAISLRGPNFGGVVGIGYSRQRRELGDGVFESLAELTRLRQLDLSMTEFPMGSLKRLNFLPNLHSLSLDDSNFNDEGARVISSFPNLSVVSLAETQITTDGLRELAKLRIKDVTITPVGGSSTIAALADFRLLRRLTVGPINEHWKEFSQLDRLVGLEELTVVFRRDDEGMIGEEVRLEEMRLPATLRRLSIKYGEGFPFPHLPSLDQCPKLEYIEVGLSP